MGLFKGILGRKRRPKPGRGEVKAELSIGDVENIVDTSTREGQRAVAEAAKREDPAYADLSLLQIAIIKDFSLFVRTASLTEPWGGKTGAQYMKAAFRTAVEHRCKNTAQYFQNILPGAVECRGLLEELFEEYDGLENSGDGATTTGGPRTYWVCVWLLKYAVSRAERLSATFDARARLDEAIREDHEELVESLVRYVAYFDGVAVLESLLLDLANTPDAELWQKTKDPETEKTTFRFLKAIPFFMEAGVDVSDWRFSRADGSSLTILLLACTSDANAQLLPLLKLGIDPHSTHENGDGSEITAVQHCAIHGFSENIVTLVENGADINETETNGWAALHWLARGWGEDETSLKLHDKTLATLSTLGADINVRDEQGRSPRDYAVEWEKGTLASLLVIYGAQLTPQEEEAKVEQERRMQEEAQRRAELEAEEKRRADEAARVQREQRAAEEERRQEAIRGMTLFLAAEAERQRKQRAAEEERQRKAAQIMLDRNTRTLRSYVDKLDVAGVERCLADSKPYRLEGMVTRAMAAPGPIHTRMPTLDPLYDIVLLLVEAGADPNETHLNTTPLPTFVAGNYGGSSAAHLAWLGRMLELGADANTTNSKGKSSLMMAMRTGRLEAAEMLIDCGADCSYSFGWDIDTPLHAAMMSPRAREPLGNGSNGCLLEAMLRSKPRVDVTGEEGRNALHLAVQLARHGGNSKLLDLLLSNGVNVKQALGQKTATNPGEVSEMYPLHLTPREMACQRFGDRSLMALNLQSALREQCK